MVYSKMKKGIGPDVCGLGAAMLSFCLASCSTVPDEGGSQDIRQTGAVLSASPDQGNEACLGLDEAVASLASQIAESMTAQGKKNVAILNFVSIGRETTVFGQFLSEELISRLFLTGKFKVIERRFLDQVMKEQDLTVSDLFESDSVADLGRLLGVEAVLLGTFTDVGIEVRANGRLISTESGELFAVAMARINKDERVAALLSGRVEESGTAKEDPAPASSGPPEGGSNGGAAVREKRPAVPTPGEKYRQMMKAMCDSGGQKGAEIARGLQKDPGFAEYAGARDWALVSLVLSGMGKTMRGRGGRIERGPMAKAPIDDGFLSAQKAVKVNANDPAALFALGYSLFLKGNLKEARPTLEKGLNLDPRMEAIPILFRKDIFEAVRRLDGKPPRHR